MWKSMRRLVYCAALLTIMSTVSPAMVRADDPPNMQDYNTYWQVAEDPTPPNPNLDYNTYWAEIQAKQQAQGQ